MDEDSGIWLVQYKTSKGGRCKVIGVHDTCENLISGLGISEQDEYDSMGTQDLTPLVFSITRLRVSLSSNGINTFIGFRGVANRPGHN